MTSFGIIIALVVVLWLTTMAYWHREQGGYYIAGGSLIMLALFAIPSIKWLALLVIFAGIWVIYKGKESP